MKNYAEAVTIVAKLLAESSYHSDMSGGFGRESYPHPAEILSKIYGVKRSKVRIAIHNVKKTYLKKLYNRRE